MMIWQFSESKGSDDKESTASSCVNYKSQHVESPRDGRNDKNGKFALANLAGDEEVRYGF
jgi:hypothetical protein